MNVLIVSDFQIYPFTTGASIAQFGMIEPLSRKCNISLLIPEQFTPSDQHLSELKVLLPDVKIYTLKESPEQSISTQIRTILKNAIRYTEKIAKRFFKDKGNTVENDLDAELARLHSYLYPPRPKKYINKIIEIIKDDNIEIIQLEFDSNLNLISLLPSHVKRVFISHECQFHRIDSHMKAKGIQTAFANYMFNLVKTIEISFLEQYDTIVTFNQDDASTIDSALKSRNKNVEVVSAPFPVLDRDFVELDRQKFRQPDKLIFVGPEIHFPNKDAIEWFLEQTALAIYQKFGLRLYVVSDWSQETIQKYKNHPSRVEFTGYLDDLYSFIQSGICVVPIRMGCGLRSKTLVAMAQGIPVISTTHALWGIRARHMESVMIADDTASFCSAVEYLLADLDRTFTLCKNAQELMRTAYSQSFTSEQRYSLYEKLLKE